jgi:hypothetical protein
MGGKHIPVFSGLEVSFFLVHKINQLELTLVAVEGICH